MATLIAAATGLFSAAGTWKVVAAASLLESSGGTTTLTTGNLDSAAMVLGAVEVDAVALKIASRAAGSPTNTITVTLRNSTGATDVLTLTINVSDLPACDTTSLQGGWIVFKFSGTHTPNGTDSYVVRVTMSATTTAVSLYTNGTANNWARRVRETTAQAPAAGDNLLVAGEHTGAGTGNDFTVTMDSVAATDFGTANTNGHVDALGVAKRGTLTYQATAATAYILRISGFLNVYSGGLLNIGTVATPCPRDSTMVLEFDCASDGQFGLNVRSGTFVAQGQSRTAGKNFVICKLNTDEAAAQTVLGVDTDTGWKSGDEIAIASTTQTRTQVEVRTLDGDAGASSITVTAGLTNAHGGTGLVAAEVILLTHHVKIRGVTSTFMTFLNFLDVSQVNMDWVEVQYVGTQFTPVGIGISTTAAGVDLRYMAIKNCEASPISVTGSAHNNWTIQDVMIYSAFTATNCQGVSIAATTGTGWTLARVMVMGGGQSGGAGFYLADLGGTISDLWTNSHLGYAGVDFADAVARGWSVNGINAHSLNGSTSAGIIFGVANVGHGTISNLYIWRCAPSSSAGIMFNSNAANNFSVTFDTGRVFGCSSMGCIGVRPGGASLVGMLFKNMDFSGDTTFASAKGLDIDPNGGSQVLANWRFENCTFGVVTGIYTAHTTADINITNGSVFVTMTLVNCKLSSTTEVSNFDTNTVRGSYIASQQHDQTVNHKVWTKYGNLLYDTTTFDVSPSQKLTPLSATYKLESNASVPGKGFLVKVASGATKTPTVKVQKDGSYNGNAARLTLKANPAIGINADVVLDTHSVGSGSFETLTGTTAAATADGFMEFVVDCDGTAGNIFVDTWAA